MTIDVQDLRDALLQRQLYHSLQNETALRHFMASHIFAVWDFQSLLKALQRELTCVTTPWLPTTSREARRLINEIVLDEESGPHPDGGHASHFELYLDAMEQSGVGTQPIRHLLQHIQDGDALSLAMTKASLPPHIQEFLHTTFAIIEEGSLHRVMAAFFYGREDIIPDMFRRLVAQLDSQQPERWSTFRFYLEEHLHLDEEKHGPAAQRLMQSICGDDQQKWQEAEETAREALQARINLWDAIVTTSPLVAAA
jgi:hypothetical protein